MINSKEGNSRHIQMFCMNKLYPTHISSAYNTNKNTFFLCTTGTLIHRKCMIKDADGEFSYSIRGRRHSKPLVCVYM